MNPLILLCLIIVYFSLLVIISRVVDKNSDEESFFTGNKKSPWYLVAFGMIGASLSGVTFVSVPGEVALKSFEYFQMVLGYIVGYLVIAFVLLPLYYRMNVTSIYEYLFIRFGRNAQLIGSSFFLLSRTLGSALRMYLVVLILQAFIFDDLNVPFPVTIALSLALIWVYTYKSGIKTIVYTDTLQSAFMLISLFGTIYYVVNETGLSFSDLNTQLQDMNLTKVFFWDNFKEKGFFWKQFVGGAIVAIAMTGLDQDLMQKNLTCPNIRDAQKNMISFTTILIFINFLFLYLGACIYFYAIQKGIELPMSDGKMRTDLIFPTMALNHFPPILGFVFFVGLIAANYASADSALASLTTSYCLDIKKWKGKELTKNKNKVHLGFTILLFFVICVFYILNNKSTISLLFTLAGYTYGPLVGLFFFGILSKKIIQDRLIPYISFISPVICYGLNFVVEYFWGYKFAYELLLVNGGLTFLLLNLIPERKIQFD